MGHKTPFRPAGRCENCKFSSPIPDNHYRRKYHTLFCRRFPPAPAQAGPGNGPWNAVSHVSDIDLCAEWEKE